jgi:hypothetical protein
VVQMTWRRALVAEVSMGGLVAPSEALVAKPCRNEVAVPSAAQAGTMTLDVCVGCLEIVVFRSGGE